MTGTNLTTPAGGKRRPRVAYVVSRFPKLTETFVLRELLAVEQEGIEVTLWPLWRERTEIMQPAARRLLPAARFQPSWRWNVLLANLRTAVRRPRRYWGTLVEGLVRTLGSWRYFLGILAIFPKAVTWAEVMRREGIEHLHAHFASHPAAAAWIIHRLAGLPFSFTAHGSDLHRDQHLLAAKVAAAKFVVAISDYNREFIARHCATPPRNVHVIHCGIESPGLGDRARDTAPPPRSSAEAAGPPFRVFCVGTLHAVKGQRYLIQAVDLLRSRGLDVEAHLVGDGKDRAALGLLADDLNLAASVIFHGSKTSDQVTALLQSAAVVAAPSVPTGDGRREGIPVALMEAMAAGVPVVASRLSGIPELIRAEQTGLLVEPGDVEGLATAIGRMIEDPALARRLSAGGQSFVHRHFDQRRSARLLARLFGATCEAPPSTASLEGSPQPAREVEAC